VNGVFVGANYSSDHRIVAEEKDDVEVVQVGGSKLANVRLELCGMVRALNISGVDVAVYLAGTARGV